MVSPDDKSLLLSFAPAQTPEPASMALLATGLGVLGMRKRRKPRQA